MTTPERVLDFWFGEPVSDEGAMMSKVLRWFRGGPELDREIIDSFRGAVEAAMAGELDHWADEPRSRLALVLLLDQFTRNVYRGDPRTYAGDAKAQELALDAFARGLDRGMRFEERVFLSMPLIHSENLAHLRRVVEIAGMLAADAPPWCKTMSGMHLEQSEKYADIVERFGRFPHRNAILGRTPTPEEEHFLEDWAEKGPPRGQPPPAR